MEVVEVEEILEEPVEGKALDNRLLTESTIEAELPIDPLKLAIGFALPKPFPTH
jgi:hypothetical protein